MTFDLRQAQRLVDSIPEVKESIPYLTELAEGSNPNIPGYLALGKLMQISELAEGAKTAEPPQGTIKDKLTQSNGIMALMGGRGQEAAQNSQMQQMQQPGPAPEGIPQPEMQQDTAPDEIMGMAYGGITSAEIDPRMFNFDRGGIVTFANPEKEKKQQVKDEDKDKRTTALGDALRALIDPIIGGVRATADYGRIRNERDAARPGLLEPLTQSEKEQRLAQVSALNRELNQVGGGNAPAPVSPEQNAEAARETQRLGANAMVRQQPVIMNQNPDLVPGVPQQPPPPPAPPKPPMGGINDGKTPVPGANISIGAAIPQPLPENEFLNMSKKFIQEQPEAFDEAKETAKINARNEAAGIGTYAKVMREQQQAMRDRFAESRPGQFEKLIGLGRAYSRAGAQAGDVGAEGASQMRAEREAAFQFEQDQFKVTEAIEKLEEARRTGNVDKIAKAEADLKKANADKKNHQMTAAASAANTLSADQRSAADRAQQLQIETAKLNAEKAKIAAMHKDSETMQLLKQVEALQKAGLIDEAKRKLENYGDIKEAGMGARYRGKDTAPTPLQITNQIEKAYEKRNSIDLMTLSNKNAKPADIARAQANLARTKQDVLESLKITGGGGGGGGQPISEAEYRALPKGATYTAPDGSQRVKG